MKHVFIVYIWYKSGNHDWCHDEICGIFATMEEALAGAERLNCEEDQVVHIRTVTFGQMRCNVDDDIYLD